MNKGSARPKRSKTNSFSQLPTHVQEALKCKFNAQGGQCSDAAIVSAGSHLICTVSMMGVMQDHDHAS